MRAVCTLLLALLIGQAPSSLAAAEPLQVLKGRIIRALAVHPAEPSRILVGNKGKQAGSGKVFESRDGGRSWRTLNGGKAVNPAATDVQAVAYGPDDTILAGTWKQGLYLSRDAGKSFERVASFPETDVRDIQIAAGSPTVIYAATGRRGVLASEDGGESWRDLGPEKTFVWSLSLGESTSGGLFAASPSRGAFASSDDGESWQPLFEGEGVYAVSADESGLNLAGETGLHSAADGAAWRKRDSLGTVKLSSLLSAGPQELLVGSWDGGVYRLTGDGGVSEHLLSGITVVHLRRAGTALLVGTWGRGLHVFPDRFSAP